MTYIYKEIDFHASGIDYPNQIWKKFKSLFEERRLCILINNLSLLIGLKIIWLI